MNVTQTVQWSSIIPKVHDGDILSFDREGHESIHGQGKTFKDCLANLDKVLKRCQETDIVLNWEKCHFMVWEGIILGHKISEKGIEVDKVKVKVIQQLPPPTIVN
jgi:hypothetical protein